MQPVDPGMNTPPPDTPATELVKEVFTEAKELIRLEVALAKDEAKQEVVAAKSAGITLGAAFLAFTVALALILVAVALAIFPGPLPALVMGLILMVSAGLAGAIGYKLLPKKPFAQTRRRLETDVETVKERMI
ncbi:MAG TPA: phage holin family protein [Polyangiaceae bacterium]